MLSSERICGAFEIVSRTVDLQSFFTVDDEGRVFGACQSCYKTKCEKRSQKEKKMAQILLQTVKRVKRNGSERKEGKNKGCKM